MIPVKTVLNFAPSKALHQKCVIKNALKKIAQHERVKNTQSYHNKKCQFICVNTWARFICFRVE